VGIGALGSHVVQFLRSEREVRFKVIDHDRVERKNTVSQFHGARMVGKTKVLALNQTMQMLWGVKLTVIPHKLASANVEQLLGDADLLVDCLDNGAARRLVQSYASRTSTPCLHGALAADGAFGRVLWSESFTIDDEPAEGAATCEDGEHLPFIVTVAAYMARAVQVFLRTERRLSFNIHPTGAMRV